MAKPIVDMGAINIAPNTLQDLYNWYLAGGDEDGGGTGGTGGTGGITNVYGGGGGDAAEDLFGGYLQNPISPVALGAYGEPGYVGGLSGDVTQVGPGRGLETEWDDPLAPASLMDDEEGGFFNWLRQKTGKITPGQKKTGIIGASAFLPFPLNLMGAATQLLPKGEGYSVGGLDEHEKGLYNTLAADDLLFKDPGTGLMKDIRGKNVYSFADDYKEGLEDEYNKFMEKYNGRKNFDKLLAEGKIKNKYHINTAKVYDSVFTNYLDIVRTAKAPPGYKDEPVKIPDAPTVEDTAPAHPGLYTPIHSADPPSGDGGYTGAGKQAEGAAASGPMGGPAYGPWKAYGGLIRKKYGNGGIVDLL